MKRLNVWIVCFVLMLIGIASGFVQAENRKLVIRESDFAITPEEAMKFSREVLSPIVDAFVKSSGGPEGLRRRILALAQGVKHGEINYIPAPAYYPDRALHAVAKLERLESRPLVIAFVPELMDLRSRVSANEFQNAVLVAFAHEMIHIELAGEKAAKDDTRNEAMAWAKTVLEIIRPLEAQGLAILPEFKQLSSLFKSVSDNPQDVRWLKCFRLR